MYLCIYSFLILFFEFVFIRYIPAHVKATAYFANLTIIATFLGMGLGMLIPKKNRLGWIVLAFPFLLFVLLCCVRFFSNCNIQPFTSGGEFFWPATKIHNVHVMEVGIFWVITIFFLLTAGCFVPLGYGLGREFSKYRPLVAYSLDIVGSITGIGLFGLLSAFCLSPVIWLLCGGIIFSFLWGKKLKVLILMAYLMILNAFLTYAQDSGKEIIWSPYYKITKVLWSGSEMPIYVNDSFHQVIVDMRADHNERSRFFEELVRDYHQPYHWIGSRGEVLILGAGTGNDVAVALQHGADHVDAVEIDPVILSIGTLEHLNRPYQDSRVTSYNTDARVFLKNCRKRYELIVYATLDSHTILAGQSNIRLDNYLYTIEAFQDIKRLLKEDGVFLLEFLALEDYIATKLYRLVETTFGHTPMVIFHPEYRHFNHALIVKKAGDLFENFPLSSPLIHDSYKLPTDNWPFLYLRSPSLPRHYLKILLMILVISFMGIRGAVGKDLLRDIRPVMFFLGAAFLLLETKSITEFSLLFGSTWTVNLFVILGILIVILLANLLLLRFPSFPRNLLFIGLMISLMLSYVIPARKLLAASPFERDLLTMILTGVPILFAAGLFASCFQREAEPSIALGWNLLGAVAGGLLEYSSLGLGIKALYLLAIVLYIAAGVRMLSERRVLVRENV